MLPGQELSSIDFESMLGGPLVAVVNAQAQAAMSSANFIKAVGFKQPPDNKNTKNESPETGEPIYVTFKYPKEIAPYQPGETPTPAQIQMMKIEVPILTMLPIPFIRIEETTIDFKAKINSMEYRQVDSSFNIKADASAGIKYPPLFSVASAKLKVSTSYQRSSHEGNNVTRNYSMNVKIRAVQDELPSGMEKIIGILEDSIRSQPYSAQDPTIIEDSNDNNNGNNNNENDD